MTTPRLDILKTYKLFIDGKFPRSESGRTTAILTPQGDVFAHLCKASRKDLRDAVEAARKAQPAWSNATAYNRGQVLYRMAEMMEGKRREFIEAIEIASQNASKPSTPARTKAKTKPEPPSHKSVSLSPAAQVEAAIDRLVCFAGWADKYSQVLGCNNPVSGPFYNFTVPEPTGVVAAIAPDTSPLLALVSLFAPAMCSGNAIIAISSETNPVPAAILGEVAATSDVPAGVLNILTGERKELIPFLASHRDIDAIHAVPMTPDESRLLKEGVAENLKRVVLREGIDWSNAQACHSPWWIEPFVEMKTIWHPAST